MSYLRYIEGFPPFFNCVFLLSTLFFSTTKMGVLKMKVRQGREGAAAGCGTAGWASRVNGWEREKERSREVESEPPSDCQPYLKWTQPPASSSAYKVEECWPMWWPRHFQDPLVFHSWLRNFLSLGFHWTRIGLTKSFMEFSLVSGYWLHFPPWLAIFFI